MNKIKGLIAATFAAYNTDGSINLEIIPSIVEKMINRNGFTAGKCLKCHITTTKSRDDDN